MRLTCFRLLFLACLLPGAWAFADEAALPPWLTERKVIGHNDLEPIEKTIGTPIYAESRGVARVESVEEGLAFCTATRVGRDLFISNFHCYDFKPCPKVQFHLAYEQGLANGGQLVVPCKNVLSKNLTYDYALFQVETCGHVPSTSCLSLPAQPRAWSDAWSDYLADESGAAQQAPPDLASFPIATLWNGPITVGQRVFAVGYPGARPKEVDRGPDCVLRTVIPQLLEERQTITHTCDTEGGSSGSPLMDFMTGYVVALHWGGTDKFNMAIPMSEVIADLKVQLPPEVFAQLRIADRVP